MGKDSFYAKYTKRILDIICALLAMTVFCWLYLIIAVLVRIKLGTPIIYSAQRAGKGEKEFKLYKFRSMTKETDENGRLLPDTKRLTKFGRLLRSTSLDELPEAFNIFIGDMSVVGPRPLPVEYLPYYYEEEKHRHDVKPGLSGWAQINGRNDIKWARKFDFDVEYTRKMSFAFDISIVIKTVFKSIQREGIGQGEKMPESLSIERKWMV